MKIVGITYMTGTVEMVLKNDSCLLNNSKPLFVPEWTEDLRATRCLVLRVSRLGKCVEERFADRYYDAVAFGMDFVAWDVIQRARSEGHSWTEALGFDYSLAVGSWMEQVPEGDWTVSPEQAIAMVSSRMTIRQGDLIYITAKCPPQPVQREQVLQIDQDGETKLFCRIK